MLELVLSKEQHDKIQKERMETAKAFGRSCEDFKEYHEKLEVIRERLYNGTALPNLWRILDEFQEKCDHDLCLSDDCFCVDWLKLQTDRKAAVEYLKAKRELG